VDTAQAEEIATTLGDLATPCLILDAERMERNITRLRARLDGLGVSLRPHLKTAKSVDVVRRLNPNTPGPITVSTLAEAEYFAIDAVAAAPADSTKRR
jgi:D-serine deaminase-like pyridoxal phosphate-dependent protein